MRQHNPNDLGSAIYRALGGRSPNTEPTSFADALKYFMRQAGGNKAAAARLMGVPRESLRDWVRGISTPKINRRREIAKSAQLSARAQRMGPAKLARLTGRSSEGITVKGAYNYDILQSIRDGGDGSECGRTVDVGQFMPDGAVDQIVSAYLNGASPDDLREEFAGLINDPLGFYSQTMALPQEHDHGWTVDRVTF